MARARLAQRVADPVEDFRDIGRAHGHELALVRIAFHADDPAGDREIAVAEHEASGARVRAEGIEGQKGARAQDDLGDRVALGRLGLGTREIRGIEDALDLLHLDRHGRGLEPERVVLPRFERDGAEPEEPGAEHVGLDGRLLGVADDLAALDEDRLIEGEADRLASTGRAPPRCLPRLDRLQPGILVGGREEKPVAHGKPPALDAPDDDAPLVEFIDVLHG